jgi:predicted solute-binding protein
MDHSPPRLGCVKYINARPLIQGWTGPVIFDRPSTLCAQLAGGQLDLALVSSFEFLRNPIYRIVDDISIACDGPVYSVVLAFRGAISQIEEIEIDPDSQTSVNLLQCLISEGKIGGRLVARSTSQSGNSVARLLIGDPAIRFRQERADEFQYLDLGQEWKNLTGLPFVFALWLIRPEIADPKPIAEALRLLRDENFERIDDLIAGEREFDHEFCERYYKALLRFNFGEKEKEGLREFQRLCQKHQLLPKSDVELDVV